MKLTDDQASEIINIEDVGTAVQLLKAYALEEEGLTTVIKKVTYGIKIKFHYRKLPHLTYKTKTGNVYINQKVYKDTDVWEELDDRIGLAKKTLLDLLTDPSKYKSR